VIIGDVPPKVTEPRTNAGGGSCELGRTLYASRQHPILSRCARWVSIVDIGVQARRHIPGAAVGEEAHRLGE
jgi:hypothetical protein